MSKKVIKDEDVAGGKGLRKVDRYLSEHLGGYKSEKYEETGKLSIYGKVVEPLLHSIEHMRRGLADSNPVEWARAKDEMKAGFTGQGLPGATTDYQDAAKGN